MPEKMISDMPLPMPRSVEDERQAARDVGVPLEPHRNAHRLDGRQQQRQVAGVLRNLAAAELAFLRQALEIRPHHRQQLQDDRRADVRHHAQRKDRDARQAAPGEHVVEAEHRVLRLLRQNREGLRVHPGGRDVIADSIDREQPEGEQHPVAEVRDGKQISQAFDHRSRLVQLIASARPPAAAILSAALPLNLCT
jgi:hypothetical protein